MIKKNQNEKKQDILEKVTYKGKELVRAGNVWCYGNEDDENVVLMEVLDQKEINESVSLSNKISVALFNRQELKKNPNVMFLNLCERFGLYDALETANIWITKKES